MAVVRRYGHFPRGRRCRGGESAGSPHSVRVVNGRMAGGGGCRGGLRERKRGARGRRR